jgi:hypothetical protein
MWKVNMHDILRYHRMNGVPENHVPEIASSWLKTEDTKHSNSSVVQALEVILRLLPKLVTNMTISFFTT